MRTIILVGLSFVGFAATKSVSLPPHAFSLSTAQCYIDCAESEQVCQLKSCPQVDVDKCLSSCEVTKPSSEEMLSLNEYCINSCYETFAYQVEADPYNYDFYEQ